MDPSLSFWQYSKTPGKHFLKASYFTKIMYFGSEKVSRNMYYLYTEPMMIEPITYIASLDNICIW